MKSASGKRPPDEAHGPGKEAIRPQQRCLAKSRKEGAHGHAALPAEVGTTLIPRSALKNSAKFRQTFSHFAVLFSKMFLFFASLVQISPMLRSIFFGKSAICKENINWDSSQGERGYLKLKGYSNDQTSDKIVDNSSSSLSLIHI